MIASLRHVRMLLAVQRTGSLTEAAGVLRVSQPAVSAALAKLEARLGLPLFERRGGRLGLTEAGEVMVFRTARALGLLDPALSELAPRLVLTATLAQLQALIAVVETESFAAAARQMGLAQPTVHRAISQMEGEVGHALFERTGQGVIATRAVRHLATVARLALAEWDMALSDIGDLAAREVGRVVIGAMPLSRVVLLGPAIAGFRQLRPALPVRVIEGRYAELVLGLRRGEVDFLLGALRPEMEDLAQEALFTDEMAVVAGMGHPLASDPRVDLVHLQTQPWVVAQEGTPAREFFARMFAVAGLALPMRLVETSSMDLMRDLLGRSDHLGFVSARQVAEDVRLGRLARVGFAPEGTARPIGLTTRRDWHPTRAQVDMIAAIRAAAEGLEG